jgi:Cdc6-like AAA superfamily ATPase
MSISDSEFEKKSFLLSRSFRPTTPVDREELFSGRRRQVLDVVDAINQDAQHIVLYGERGVGKTSLAKILSSKLTGEWQYKLMPHINCAAQDTFADIWRRVFLECLERIEEDQPTLPEELLDTLRAHADQLSDLTPDSIRRTLNAVGRECLFVVMIDEFDTVQSDETRQTMADALKFLSDKNVPATVMLIGVADDVEDLIHQHQSTERCLIQVPMPRMSLPEISAVITKGLDPLEMHIDQDALNSISYVSKGLPYYPHLLGLHAGREALAHKSLRVTKEHVRRGIVNALDRVQASVQASYRDAVSSSQKDAQYKGVLLACALARTDGFGFFAPVDVREPYSKVKRHPTKIEAFVRLLHAFSETDRGPVLERKIKGTRRPRFRFVNPLLQPYVLLRGVVEGLIAEEDLEYATKAEHEPQSGMLF